MFEQKESEKGKLLRSKGKRKYYFSNAIIFYKHLLKCTRCTWNITYSEHSGSLDVSNNSVFCPVCKDGKIESSKYLLKSNNSYLEDEMSTIIHNSQTEFINQSYYLNQVSF